MENLNKKDNLTDLVETVSTSNTDTQKPNNGVLSTPSGELVTLDFKLSELFKKIRTLIKAKEEREVLEWLIKNKKI